jgi:hypothetical protein
LSSILSGFLLSFDESSQHVEITMDYLLVFSELRMVSWKERQLQEDGRIGCTEKGSMVLSYFLIVYRAQLHEIQYMSS